MENEKNPQQKLRIFFNLLVLFFPVLGVLFLGWSGFDMMFIYLTEAAILSYFGTKKQNLILNYKTKSARNSTSAVWVFFIFGFFYVFIRMAGMMGDALNYPSGRHLDSLVLMLLHFMFAPLIYNPEILIIMAMNFVSALVDYLRYKKKEEYIEPIDNDPSKIVMTSVLKVFAIVFVSFTVFWFVTLFGAIFGWNTGRFVNFVMAFVLLGIRNAGEVLRIMSRKNLF